MYKALKDLTNQDIITTCEKYSNNFESDCDVNCPFYMIHSWSNKKTTTNCMTNYEYIKKNPNVVVELQ